MVRDYQIESDINNGISVSLINQKYMKELKNSVEMVQKISNLHRNR